MQIAGELHEDGLLELRKGSREKARRSTIKPTPAFCEMLGNREVKLDRALGAETIILKASKGRKQPKLLIDYRDTPETVTMRAEVEAVNGKLGATSITLGQKPVPLPIHLTRRFQIDHPEDPHTFHQHGRLYGGFWMSLPRDQRHLLRINSEEIVDLDFRAMFVQLAYLEAGQRLPAGDPYDGVDGLSRSAAKLGISALLCRSQPMQRLPRDLRRHLDGRWNAQRLSKALEERHRGISQLFGRGVGLRLMKTESDILLAVLKQLLQQNVPALPMHDGVMVPASAEQAAKLAMMSAAKAVVGTTLCVVCKPIRPPEHTNPDA